MSRPFLAAAALYAAVAVILTYPLVVALGTAVPTGIGDSVLNTWIVWWNTQARPLSEAWWLEAPIFHPARGAIAFSEHLLGLAPLTSPIQWLGGSALLAHNVAFLAAFPLSALAAHALVYALVGRHDAALVAGLAFGFSPYWIAHLPQVQMISAYGMPIALLGLHRHVQTGRWRWLAVFGAAWLFQALVSGYYLLFFPVLLAGWLAWFAPPWRRPGDAGRIAFAWVIASLPLVPILARYRAVQQAFGMFRGREEILRFSADLTSLLDASPLLWLWRSPIAFHRPEGELFPGVTVTLLAAIGVAVRWRAWPRVDSVDVGTASARGLRRLRTLLAMGGAASAIVTLAVLIAGRIDTTFGGLRIVVAGVGRPLLIASVALAAWWATGSRARRAWREADPLVFYSCATVVAWLFALGPTPRVLGSRFWQAGPYAWLLWLPGFDAVRVPARFAAIATLCVAVAGGLAVDRLMPRARRWRWAVGGLLALAIVAEGWISNMPAVAAPAPAAFALGDTRPAAVLELPMGGAGEDLAAMYRAMGHGLPLVNGYSGYEPAHYTALRMAFEARDGRVLDELAVASGPLAIVIGTRADADGAWTRFVGGHAGARLVETTRDRQVFWLPKADRGAATEVRALPIRVVSANRRGESVGALIDGRRNTAWSTEAPQDGAEEVVVDVGSSETVVGVRLWIGRLVTHAPRELQIDVSADGTEWATAWHGPTAALVYRGALDDEREVGVRMDIAERAVRFLRLRQTGRTSDAPWSMGEIDVLAPMRR